MELEDKVNHPNHYGGDTTYECIKVLKNWLEPSEYIGFCKGNALKYLCRLGKKGNPKEDLEKAIWYMEALKRVYYEDLGVCNKC